MEKSNIKSEGERGREMIVSDINDKGFDNMDVIKALLSVAL